MLCLTVARQPKSKEGFGNAFRSWTMAKEMIDTVFGLWPLTVDGQKRLCHRRRRLLRPAPITSPKQALGPAPRDGHPERPADATRFIVLAKGWPRSQCFTPRGFQRHSFPAQMARQMGARSPSPDTATRPGRLWSAFLGCRYCSRPPADPHGVLSALLPMPFVRPRPASRRGADHDRSRWSTGTIQTDLLNLIVGMPSLLYGDRRSDSPEACSQRPTFVIVALGHDAACGCGPVRLSNGDLRRLFTRWQSWAPRRCWCGCSRPTRRSFALRRSSQVLRVRPEVLGRGFAFRTVL